MPDPGALGIGESLIVLFLLGMILLLSLLVVVTVALVSIWGPRWLEQQHRQWHAERPDRAEEGG